MMTRVLASIAFLAVSTGVFAEEKTELPAKPSVFKCLNIEAGESSYNYSGPNSKDIEKYCDVSKPFSLNILGQGILLLCCSSTGVNPPPSDRR